MIPARPDEAAWALYVSQSPTAYACYLGTFPTLDEASEAARKHAATYDPTAIGFMRWHYEPAIPTR